MSLKQNAVHVSAHVEQTIPPLDKLPAVFRIESIQCTPWKNGKGYDYIAVLYHDQASISVSFTRSQPDIRLKADLLVSIRWNHPVRCADGSFKIARLVLLEQPVKALNLFHTVPHHWVSDRALVKQAAELWDCIPGTLQELLRAVLWEGHRFRRFCERPSSLTDHHAQLNGNLVHTVEVVSTIKTLAIQFPHAHLGIALSAGFLHDAGKADEYNPWKGGSWGMTNRGRLVGHRHTIIEWLAVALATNRIALPEHQYLSLVHAITAAPGAEWLGIRSPMTPESTLLSLADRLSGEKSLVAQLAKGQGGWGDKYPHKKGQPFTIAPEMQAMKQKTKRELMAEF